MDLSIKSETIVVAAHSSATQLQLPDSAERTARPRRPREPLLRRAGSSLTASSAASTHATHGESRSVSSGMPDRRRGRHPTPNTTTSPVLPTVTMCRVCVKLADAAGAPCGAHPGCEAELRVVPQLGVYFGQMLPDDVLVPPVSVFGAPLCLLRFADVSISVALSSDYTLLRLKVTRKRPPPPPPPGPGNGCIRAAAQRADRGGSDAAVAEERPIYLLVTRSGAAATAPLSLVHIADAVRHAQEVH